MRVSARWNAMVVFVLLVLRLPALGCRPSVQRFQAFVSSCAREVCQVTPTRNSLGGVFLMQHVTHACKLHLSTMRATDNHFFFHY